MKQIDSYVRQELLRAGFRTQRGTYAVEIKPDTLGYVALNVASNRGDGLIGIAPLVGVESIPLRDELNRLQDEKPRTRQPSLVVMLGYIMPEKKFLEWLMNPTEDIHQRNEMSRMCQAIERYGLPFMREHGTLQIIIKSLETMEYTFREKVIYHLPIAYRLQGLEEKARGLVEKTLHEMLTGQASLPASFQDFAQRFLAS